MNKRRNTAAAAYMAIILLMLFAPLRVLANQDAGHRKSFRQAVSLFDYGLYERAGEMFAALAGTSAGGWRAWTAGDTAPDTDFEGTADIEALGYCVLCATNLQTKGYEVLMNSYIARFPYGSMIPQIRFAYLRNCFDAGDFAGAAAQLEQLSPKKVYRAQRPELLFKQAYCSYELGDLDRAVTLFKDVIYHTNSPEYVLPSHYFLGYTYYSREEFSEAERHFTVSATDARFSELSNYYILECRFMAKDYRYVVENGPAMMSRVPQDRQRQLSRLLSESYLVLGDARAAADYYDREAIADKENKSDEDLFYAGSVLFAVKDWAGAAENFSKIQNKTDSIGQVANYELASCYLNMKNKVLALEAFKYASESKVNADIREDAYYNYAKLAFDLNGDISVFENYLKEYSDLRRGDQVYSYIAVGALRNRDYAGAVESYDKIDELDDAMQSNYMKANFLRAQELIDNGSWRSSVPCLKAAAYYSDRREGFNQLSRYWLAEAYYRDGKYDDAFAGFRDLYNTAALYGTQEARLLTYNMAYCRFSTGEYAEAARWFEEYLVSGDKAERKDALLRDGDSKFRRKDYAGALTPYAAAIEEYPDPGDIYPYYCAALTYGLTGDNAKKISTLEEVYDAPPSSAFYPEAMCELGVTYSRTGNDLKAGECFTRLIENTKDSTYISMALVELGTLAMKNNDKAGATAYYRRVIETMPQSSHTEDALLALESVYRADNDAQGYLAYLDSVGKSGVKTEQEREDMIFSSAEQVYLAGNYAKALAALNSYMDAYPEGVRRAEAEFYMAESYRNMDQIENAVDRYASVMTYGTGSFLELATLRYSELSYRLQKYADAYEGYTKLLATAQIDVNIHDARLGMMRSAYNGRMYSQSVEAASAVIQTNNAKLSGGELLMGAKAEIRDENTEASYIKAKSHMAMSQRDLAIPLFAELAKDPSTDYGAEASYILILDSFNRADFSDVEDRVFAFSESPAPRQYWLAKSFVVLGDAYAEQGDFKQALATFESVRDGYNPETPDDVKDNLDERIRKAGELAGNNNN